AKAGRLQLVLRSPEDTDVPDLALFPERAPVLALRAGLTSEQQRDGKDGGNQAYAGEILPRLAGPTAAPGAKPRAAAGGRGGRAPVLALRAGLTSEQQRDGKDGVNQAYAGEMLPELAGPTAAPVPKPRAATGGGGGRSIEVVRGGDVQAVRY